MRFDTNDLHQHKSARAILFAAIIAVFVFPADMVFRPLGATGFVSMVLAVLLFVIWLAASILGLHKPIARRHPARFGLAILWLATLASYARMPQEVLTATGRASADRWLIAMVGVSGLILVTADSTRSIAAARAVVRALICGGVIASAVALYQFITHTDPLDYVRGIMIGMEENGGNTTFQVRSAFVRVAGPTFTPIELGVVSAMILPLAVWRAMYNRAKNAWYSWIAVLLLGLSCALTVSRSAILGLAIVAAVLVPFLPAVARRWAIVIIPLAVTTLFVAMPGFMSTMGGAITAGTSDPSLNNRVSNYPRVEAMFFARPLTGIGPATYLPESALELLDNQYLHSAVEMGGLGVAAVLLFFGAPVFSAVKAARYFVDGEARVLAAAVGASATVAFVDSATFDSFSFPVFMIVTPVIAGLSGALWLLAREGVAGRHPDVVQLSRSSGE